MVVVDGGKPSMAAAFRDTEEEEKIATSTVMSRQMLRVQSVCTRRTLREVRSVEPLTIVSW